MQPALSGSSSSKEEPYLRKGNGSGDLNGVERATIAQAFDGVPALLLRSETLDWAERIEELINAHVNDESSIEHLNGTSVLDLTSDGPPVLHEVPVELVTDADDGYDAEAAVLG
jgi:hypothetical protein